jgi:hypothetical protein
LSNVYLAIVHPSSLTIGAFLLIISFSSIEQEAVMKIVINILLKIISFIFYIIKGIVNLILTILKWMFNFSSKACNNRSRKTRRLISFSARHQSIFGGSHLPRKPVELIKQGWRKSNNSESRGHNPLFFNPITQQRVLFHEQHVSKNGKMVPSHYHWLNWWSFLFRRKKEQKKFALLREPYLTKDGIPVRKGDADSHIFPKE